MVLLSVLKISVFLVALSFVVNVNCAERGSSCKTPNNEAATCKSINACKVMLDAIRTRNSTAVQFAKDSQCGYDYEPLVCCGTTAFPSPEQDVFSIFSTPPPFGNKINPQDKQNTENLILENFNTKALPDRTVCGLEREANRIYGGEITGLDEFPWVVAIEYDSRVSNKNVGVRCGGSIINNRYVLTAAHCILDREFKIAYVRLGEWKLDEDPDCQQLVANEECADRIRRITIKEEIPHPFYSKKSRNNDIGLLKLDEDVAYTQYIRPICLPPVNLPDPPFGTNLTVTGWGATENGSSSDIKLKVSVPLLSNGECSRKLDGKISANQLCAGGDRGKDSCQGDSGGPLMRTYENAENQQSQWYQEGVVSYGVGCGRVGYPAIYTRVNRYITWIINNIKEN